MHSYDPSIYDLFHDPGGEDARFYKEKAKESGGPILELGVGTGRVLLPIAREGIEIHGLELDPVMLDALREKLTKEPPAVQEKVQLFRGDMRHFSVPGSYVGIQIPFRSFLHNLDAAAQLDCLRCCLRLLRPGGRILFNVFYPALGFMARNHNDLAGAWRWRQERRTPSGGLVVQSEAVKFDALKQRLWALLRYDAFDARGVLERSQLQSLELAYLYPRDIEERLTAAGFTEINIAGSFSGRPIEQDTDELVVSARRPR
ncbi:MAG: class I SAM-dependent methyltransferase [Myxococcota bacterium]